MKSWIERQRNLADYTISSLLRRKRKNAALMFVYALLVFLLASVMFFTSSLKKEASIILQNSPEMVIQRLIAGRHTLIPISYGETLKDIPGVSAVKARLWGYYYDPIIGANYTLMVADDLPVKPGSISIGEGVSRARLAYEGDTLEFKAFDGVILEFEVESLISSDSALISSDMVLISEADFRRLFGTPQEYATDLTLRVKNSKEIDTVAVKIAERLPDTRQLLRDELLRTYDAVFNWRAGLLIVILCVTLLAFIILAWDKASGLSGEERREIGILKAIGWESSDVIQMKFWEGIVISLTSFLAGILLGYVHIFFFSAKLFEPVLKGWAVLYPHFRIVPYINAAQVLTLFFFTVIPYLVATIIPSWKAAIVDPDSVMK